MNQGKLIQYDQPENLYRKPQNIFVGWFIGDPGMNFLYGSLDEKRKVIDFGTFKYDVSYLMDVIKEKATGSELVLGFRPENVYISEKGEKNWIRGKCVEIEGLGNKIILHLQLDDGQNVSVRLPPSGEWNIGKEYWLYLSREVITIFDKKTGEAIA